MKILLKRTVIALGLLVVCVAVLAGVKSYGVWVISALAVVLFVLGLLRKDKPAGPGSGEGAQTPDGTESGSGEKKRDGSDGT